MRLRLWLIFAITYIITMLLIVFLSYIIGHVLLQMPLVDVYITAGLSIVAGTIGVVVAIVITLVRIRKRAR
jgi:hypothetical protein